MNEVGAVFIGRSADINIREVLLISNQGTLLLKGLNLSIHVNSIFEYERLSDKACGQDALKQRRAKLYIYTTIVFIF